MKEKCTGDVCPFSSAITKYEKNVDESADSRSDLSFVDETGGGLQGFLMQIPACM